MNTSRPFTFDRVVRILAGLAMLAGAVWMINKLRNVLLVTPVVRLVEPGGLERTAGKAKHVEDRRTLG